MVVRIPILSSSLAEKTADALRVLPDFILRTGEQPDKDTVRGLDALVSRAEGLFGVGHTSRGQNLKCKTRLARGPHNLIHTRRIALQVALALHLHQLAVEHLLP